MARYCASPKLVQWREALGTFRVCETDLLIRYHFSKRYNSGPEIAGICSCRIRKCGGGEEVSFRGGSDVWGWWCILVFQYAEKCHTCTTKAEYVALADVIKEVLFFR